MLLLSLLGQYFSYYKAGGFVLVIAGLLLFLLMQIFRLLTFPVSLLTDSRLIIVIFVVLFPPLFGFLLTRNFLRLQKIFRLQNIAEKCSKKYPRLFNVTENLIQLLSAGDIREKKFHEVEIEFEIGGKKIRVLGFVVREYSVSGEIWCRVAVPTYPMPATGNFVQIRKTDLIYTGRTLPDTAFTFMSFGTK